MASYCYYRYRPISRTSKFNAEYNASLAPINRRQTAAPYRPASLRPGETPIWNTTI